MGQVTFSPIFEAALLVAQIALPVAAVAWLWDVWRRPAFHWTGAYPRLRWAAVPAAFLVVRLVGLFAPTSPVVGIAIAVLVPSLLVGGVVYLLRIVYPSAKRLEQRRAAQQAEEVKDDTGEGPSAAA